ncbi:MAG: hypothetical protein IPF79_09150 [Ignavibacteria bacterium]|nr:hypothetical protein [Ignavibacteria bacterium]
MNKAVEQLTKLGVEIPSDLRSLKLRLSANDVASVSNPQITMHLTGVESLIDGLRELSQAARALREKLKTGAIVSGAKKHYGVALEELLDAGLLSTDDRLELQWTRGSGVFEGKVLGDGTVSAKSAGGWKQYDSLSTAASEIAGRPLNGWDCWRRTNADGKRTSLKEIRAEYLNQENDS